MSTEIPAGTEVQWRGTNGKTNTGTVLAFIQARSSLNQWEASYSSDDPLGACHISWAGPHNADIARLDRYVVQTTEGCRTVSARQIERSAAKVRP